MMFMRPPQHGHGWVAWSVAAVLSGGCGWCAVCTGATAAISSRIRAMVSVLVPLASRPQHLHRQEIVWTAADPARAVERYPTTRHDHVDVWMMGHRGAPGVEHRGEADLDAQALGIGRNRTHCLRGSLEQEIVDDGLVVVGDGPDPPWQCEHDMEVRDVQQF